MITENNVFGVWAGLRSFAIRAAILWDSTSLHLHEGDDVLKAVKVCRIPRVERKAVRGRRGGDQEICDPRTAGTSGGPARGEDTRKRTGRIRIKGKRVPRRSGPLQTVLTARPLQIIVSRMWTRREFGKRDRGNGRLVR